MLFTSLLAAALAPLAVLGQSTGVTITNPTATRWWIAESDAEIAWTGDIPTTDITWFLYNPNIQLLSTGMTGWQINGLAQAYQKSVAFKLAPGANPGTGYVVKITNSLNSSLVYGTSDSFEIKAKGSAYPPVPSATQVTASSASAAGASGAGSSASTAASAAASTAKSAAGAVTAPMVAVVAAGALTYFLA